jgi:hypothetical protein
MTNDMSAETVKDVRLCAHGNAVCRTCDRYWWHKAIADNLAEIVASGMAGYNAKGIASNIRMSAGDVEKYVRQMIEWGELVEIDPLWDYPALWVGLA